MCIIADQIQSLRDEVARLDRENAKLASLRDDLIGRLASEMLLTSHLQSELENVQRTLAEVIGERYPNQLSLR